MGGTTQPIGKKWRVPVWGVDFKELPEDRTNLRVADKSVSQTMHIALNNERKRAEEAELNQLNQQLEDVRQQREATKAQSEQSRIESEARKNALDNQQRALEQTGAVDEVGGGTAKPYNPTSSASTTVEGLGGERDVRRKRNQLTAYLGI